MSQDYKAEERIIKDIIYRNVKPVDPEKKKKNDSSSPSTTKA